jgi:hypothetical protein
MRKEFPGHYNFSDEEFKELWKNCTFSFDTNVLLNLFKFSPATRDYFLEILYAVENRIWIPHQVAYEFHKHREHRIAAQFELYDFEKFSKKFMEFKASLSSYKHHPIIDHAALVAITESAEKQLRGNFEDSNAVAKYQQDSELLKSQIGNLFQDKVGPAYEQATLKTKYEIARQRLAEKTPPGYEDEKSKKEPEMFGDSIIWFQLLEFAAETRRSVILVTDENKEDWWLKLNGKTIGPRPELRAEMKTAAEVDFYMYQSEKFMEFAGSMLGVQPKSGTRMQDILEEVQAVRQRSRRKKENSRLESLHSEFHAILNRFRKKLGLERMSFEALLTEISQKTFISEAEIDHIRTLHSRYLTALQSEANIEDSLDHWTFEFLEMNTMLEYALKATLEEEGEEEIQLKMKLDRLDRA